MSVTSQKSENVKLRPMLGGVPETLLIPLWARAVEQERSDPLIVDPDAARIVKTLDYDFSQFRRKRVETENFCVRSRVIDDAVSQILRDCPGTPVVEFGPGLDTRFQRIGHLASSWMEVDLPEVVQLRNEFFAPNSNRTTVSFSMLDPAWMDACPSFNRPPLFIAEGVFYFFSHEQIGDLLRSIATRFPGASFLFDAISPAYLKLSNLQHPLSDSELQFALSSGASELSKWDDRWSIRNYIGYGDSPWYDSAMHRFSWWKRLAVKLLPFARHAFMVVHAATDEESNSDEVQQ